MLADCVRGEPAPFESFIIRPRSIRFKRPLSIACLRNSPLFHCVLPAIFEVFGGVSEADARR